VDPGLGRLRPAPVRGGSSVLVVVVLVLLIGACPARDGARDADLTGSLTVLAAASLSDVLGEVAEDFRAAHPELEVRVASAGSQRLATQILEGAEADVFATADVWQMARVVEAGLAASDPQVLATNRLALVVEPGNPAGIRDPADLARPDLRVVLAAEEVPAGRYARQALENAGIEVEPVSLEADVRAVLSRVALGEADVGIVYLTDVYAAGDRVDGLPLPSGMDVRVTYPVVRLAASPEPELADAFIAHLLSDDGLAVLREHGFGPPDPPAAAPTTPVRPTPGGDRTPEGTR
jgi:molybdate transport system substrate-binding protein